MDTESVAPKESKHPNPVFEEGWYLLRENLFLSNRTYRAGALVEHLGGKWFLKEGRERNNHLPLAPEMVCRPFYHGVSLYEIHCTDRGAIFARPVLSEVPSERIDPLVVHLSLQKGEGRVCVKFGHCFLPLELFNW